MELTDRRIVVTGGAGTIGSHVVDQLVDAGAGRIVVVDDLSRGRLADISAARREFGWKPSVGLHEGLAELVAWWRAQR